MRHVTQPLFQYFPPRSPAILLLLLLMTRIGWIVIYRAYAIEIKHSTASQEDMYENGEIAKNIVEGRGFSQADDSQLVRGPTAAKPPAYPYILAGAKLIWGSSIQWPVRIFQAILTTCSIYIVGILFTNLFGQRIGALTILLMTISPGLGKIDIYFENTALTIFFSSLFFYFLWKTFKTEKWQASVQSGLFMGLMCLTNPSFLPCVPMVIGTLVYPHLKHRWKKALTILAVGGVVIFPWMTRNRLVLGKWIPINSNFGFNIWYGSNPTASGAMAQYGGGNIIIPDAVLKETARMNELGRFSPISGIRYSVCQGPSTSIFDPSS